MSEVITVVLLTPSECSYTMFLQESFLDFYLNNIMTFGAMLRRLYSERKRIVQRNYVAFGSEAFELWLQNFKKWMHSGLQVCLTIDTYTYLELWTALHVKINPYTKYLMIITFEFEYRDKVNNQCIDQKKSEVPENREIQPR